MDEDKTVTGPHLDDPRSTAPNRNHLRDPVDNAGMMTQEEILETVRETIEEVPLPPPSMTRSPDRKRCRARWSPDSTASARSALRISFPAKTPLPR